MPIIAGSRAAGVVASALALGFAGMVSACSGSATTPAAQASGANGRQEPTAAASSLAMVETQEVPSSGDAAPDEVDTAIPIDSPASSKAKLEDMTYSAARKAIAGFGWKPFPGGCTGGGTSPETCVAVPEIDQCSGVDPGFCTLHYSKPGRCLTVVTKGGPPGPQGSGDTRVDGVAFSKGPCPTA